MTTILPAYLPGKGEPTSNPLLETAPDDTERGLRGLSLHSPTFGGCSCGNCNCKSVGKHPRTASGLIDARFDPVISADGGRIGPVTMPTFAPGWRAADDHHETWRRRRSNYDGHRS